MSLRGLLYALGEARVPGSLTVDDATDPPYQDPVRRIRTEPSETRSLGRSSAAP